MACYRQPVSKHRVAVSMTAVPAVIRAGHLAEYPAREAPCIFRPAPRDAGKPAGSFPSLASTGEVLTGYIVQLPLNAMIDDAGAAHLVKALPAARLGRGSQFRHGRRFPAASQLSSQPREIAP